MIQKVTKETLIPIGLAVGLGMGLYYVGFARASMDAQISKNSDRIQELRDEFEADRLEHIQTRRRIWESLRKTERQTAQIEYMVRSLLDHRKDGG